MRTRRARRGYAAVLALAVVVQPLAADGYPDRDRPGEAPPWRPDVSAAIRYADARAGTVSFAVVDEQGGLHGYRRNRAAPLASVLKVMLMTAYLRLPSVRDRPLRSSDRSLLAPMIRWSDNVAASRIRDMVGGGRLHALARRAGMRRFSFVYSPWGLSRSSPLDQARLMFRLERFIPDRHEGYARRLLRTIVRRQRWGIPRAAPEGWTVFFKGGWGSGTGWVSHQVAFLESGHRRIAVAVFVRNSPSHAYGTSTVRGVARRLLRGL